jgi:integrase
VVYDAAGARRRATRTHATILLSASEPVSVVSERLGHRSEVVTMTVYSHVLPGDQKRAASRFAELVGGASSSKQVSRREDDLDTGL